MAEDGSGDLVVSVDGPVRTITLNRPEHYNAIDVGLHRRVGSIWREIAADRNARVVVLTGAGKAFSAGGDVGMLEYAAKGPRERYETVEDARRIIMEMVAFPLPIIAAVNGAAVGLGCSLAMFSDVVFMSERAYFADPHVTVGLVAADGGALTWPLLTSLLWAKEYLLTGDRIDASTARSMGLANHVVAADDLLPRARELADRLAGQPRQALEETKRALNVHLRHAVMNVLDFALAAESASFMEPDFGAGLETLVARSRVREQAGTAGSGVARS